MKRIILIIIILFSINVYADSCDSKEFKRLKDLANKIEFTYDYKIVKSDSYDYADFSITAVNLNEDLKVMIIYDLYNNQYREFKNNNEHKSTLTGFMSGENVQITIKAYTNNECSSKTVLTKNIKMPYYNHFYDEDFCKDNHEFKYCKILFDEEISSDNYVKALNEYIGVSSEEENNEIVKEEINSTIKYIIVGVVSLIVAVITLYFLFKKRENNSL